MGFDATVWAGVWAIVAIVWIALAAREKRGRSWHVALALVPFAGIAAAAWGAPQLAAAAQLWLVMSLVLLAAVFAAWVIGTALRNHGVMDILYPLAPLSAAVAGAALTGVDAFSLALLIPMAVWAGRLSLQTLGQNAHAEREPYASWRARNGSRWIWWSFFQVHLLQGVSIMIWILPIALAFSAPQPRPMWPAILGVAVWLTGFALQTVADSQLTAFRRDPANRGRLLDTGVWALVRHPNYLGEAVMWWGYAAFALAHPWGWLGVIGPLFATWFMGYASAAPYKERHMARTRPELWAAYCARTPRFLPWPRPPRPRDLSAS